jgi:hypothetical protein
VRFAVLPGLDLAALETSITPLERGKIIAVAHGHVALRSNSEQHLVGGGLVDPDVALGIDRDEFLLPLGLGQIHHGGGMAHVCARAHQFEAVAVSVAVPVCRRK